MQLSPGQHGSGVAGEHAAKRLVHPLTTDAAKRERRTLVSGPVSRIVALIGARGYYESKDGF